MNQSRGLSIDDIELQKRSRELEAREIAVTSREALLAGQSKEKFDYNILKKRYEAKQEQLKTLIDKMDKARQEHEHLLSQYAETTKDHNYKIENLVSDTRGYNSKLEELAKEIDESKKQSQYIQFDIKEQKKYYGEQQLVTERAVSDWNSQLQEFSKACEEEYQKKVVLLRENSELEAENVLLQAEGDKQEQRILNLGEAYTTRADELKTKLKMLTLDTERYQTEINAQIRTIASKSKDFKAKEKELVIREKAVQDLEDDLVARELKFRSDIAALS